MNAKVLIHVKKNTELLEIGQHQNIDVWFTQLLLNSELSQEESRRKYKR